MDPITTLATVPAIVAIVNLAKKLGLDGQKSLVLATILGVVVNVANYYLGNNGGYQAAIEGLLLGLASAGIYDTAKTASTLIAVKNI